MNKKLIMIPIVIIILIVVVNFSLDSPSEKENKVVVFHVTLADPNLYNNGIFTEKFSIEKGEYYFGFVPNGSSPEILSITLKGENFDFSEEFELRGILHQTGISEYFTWEYDGQKNISISEMQEVVIIINPNENEMGSVSVDILENLEA